MGQGQRGPQAAADIRRHQAAIVIGVEGVKHRIAAQPLLAGDAAIAVEVIVDGGVDGDGGTIVIRDRGHGIDDATLARIGEPFFTTKGPGEGMGLGLFLASTVVEAAGGTLRIASSAGEGTIVTVTLPFRDQP